MIYVFKTSVDSPLKLQAASELLDQLFPNCKWNFDLEDCDNILRVDSRLNAAAMLENNTVFECIELE
ncbi:hypothetical protein [Flavobacterium sp. S87F.05.LMB.W.Kidney.N]|uniref:hypothetical protein n=1 Tax=Flavobacterium sp. S87F.05.LMB.W.Kidney.N TaxID=1278758 RepID=UPI0010647C88|nr:hypothetical protein [Flavobacterium sp. S87F.05.LMB.W.Kidney.N]TDX11249.1 hypothetical protein EDB96_2033 [Flavobacterium sp. S87F.05.LMB.W.Kidney.N]